MSSYDNSRSDELKAEAARSGSGSKSTSKSSKGSKKKQSKVLLLSAELTLNHYCQRETPVIDLKIKE